MSWKFNPPPGWPAQPEGWQPPPGWAPDPGWPPAPAGWQFWVPAGSPAETGSPAPTVHEAPTSLANPTVPMPSSGQPASPYAAGPLSSSPPAPFSPAGPYSPGAPAAPPLAGAYQPAGSYPPPGPFPPTTAYPPAGSAPPAGTSTGARPWYQQWWAIGGTVLAVLLVGCLGGSVAALVTDSDDTVTPPSPTPGPTSTGTPPTGAPPSQDPGGGGEGLGPGEEQSGEGPTIIPLDLPPDANHMVTITYTGEGFFSSQLVDANGEYVGSLGSSPFDTTEYTGTWPVDLGLLGAAASAIDITNADGPWTVEINDVSEAPLWPEQTDGAGDTVLRIDPAVAGDEPTVTGTHDGDSNFIVWAYSPEEFNDILLFNEIGVFDGAADQTFNADQIVLHVQADGSWTLTPP